MGTRRIRGTPDEWSTQSDSGEHWRVPTLLIPLATPLTWHLTCVTPTQALSSNIARLGSDFGDIAPGVEEPAEEGPDEEPNEEPDSFLYVKHATPAPQRTEPVFVLDEEIAPDVPRLVHRPSPSKRKEERSKRRMSFLESRCHTAQKKLRRSRQQDDVHRRLRMARADNAALRLENSKLKDKLGDMNQKKEMHRRKVERLETVIARTRSELSRAKKKNKRLEAKHSRGAGKRGPGCSCPRSRQEIDE